jgi:hypothetical protein
VAADHQLLPALGSVARATGWTATEGDRAPFAILEDAWRANVARVADLTDQGGALVCAFAAAGVDVVPLKGWHGLVVARWPDPAFRTMVDLDALVASSDVDRAEAVLGDLGYVDLGVRDEEGFGGHERPARGCPGRAGSVELHEAVLVPRRARLLPAADVLAGTRVVPLGELAVRVPSATHAMTLVIAHAQLQDDGARLLRIPLRALVDVAVMDAGDEGRAVDWAEVSERFARVRASVPLAGFATALDDLFDLAIPVPRRGGYAWWRAAQALVDRPRTAAGVRAVACVPRALSAERMAHRYGAHTLAGRTRARATHVARGLRKRVWL